MAEEKKVELNEEKLEGVAGGGIGVNTKVDTDVKTNRSGNKTDTNQANNKNSQVTTKTGNTTNTVEGKENQVYQQVKDVNIGGDSKVTF